MKKRLIATFILIAYGAMLIKVMVFKDVPLIRIGRLRLNFGGSQEGPANLIPFKTILPYLLGEKGFLIAAINLLGNVVLLMPIGFLVPFVYLNMTWKKSLALAVATGFFIEGMQEVLRVGIFDIDDVILNGLGVMVGYWTFTLFANKVRSIKAKNIIFITAVIVIAAVAAVYGVAVYQKSQRPVNFRPRAENNQFESINKEEGGIPQGEDPCNGTGGTGQIVGVGDHTITIKRRDGVNEIIKLTGQTSIRTSTGLVSEFDLKIGYNVTVVVESDHLATAVLICNEKNPESVK